MKKFTSLFFVLYVVQFWSQATPDWYNIQWLSDGTNGSNTSLTVNAWTTVTAYAQVYEPGVTDALGQGAGIECWISGNGQNTDPSTWPSDSWIPAEFNIDTGNNDEYKLVKQMDFVGTAYVAARWRLNGGPYVYGGYNGPWNGTSNKSIQLVVNPVIENDLATGAIPLTVTGSFDDGDVTGTIYGATGDQSSPCTDPEYSFYDVWYSLVVPASGSVTVETRAADTNSVSGTVLIASSQPNNGSQIACNINGGGSSLSLLSLSGLTAGSTIYISVSKPDSTPPTVSNSNFKIAAYDASLGMQSNLIEGFKMFPNPVLNILSLTSEEPIQSIGIYNMFGQEVKTLHPISSQTDVDVSNLAIGAYIVKVQVQNEVGVYNLLKN